MGYIERLLDVSGKKSLFSFFASWEFGKMLVDGNLAHNNLFRGPSGNLVGTDHYGNKYYENNSHTYGRRRWVVYADKFDYNVTSVPPEWHGWVNYINDYNPVAHTFKKPIYHVRSGEGGRRRRWVVYADKFDYNVTSVPPEWHGWVNYINDYNPVAHTFKKPIYHVQSYISKTGSPECYNPKGSWFNPQKRNWKKYESWQPGQSA
ncbi:hypothetical protein GPECTOR_11g6 [Gonium pectorale]|uniref:NADH dehydrogenase [ubiquinone] 1 alpha subcomplex subunit 12 n=1 Tax=Gonium pectorale TaxID=33097 RepID=A0A150GQ54_GONPE|nr:hypothetical protein GPECTOR_11g6 [Gonium pectorale]|eukprot:KXZ51934.1 hypothetical protein GPECTOR_11g6 [Gonium pectorale]